MRTSTFCNLFACIFGAIAANGAAILNPSFEEAGPVTPPGPDFSGVSIKDWDTTFSPSGVWGIHQNSATLAKLILPPDGNSVGVIYRRGKALSVTAGDYAILFQAIDLTGVNSISFNAALDQVSDSTRQGTWSDSLVAQFVIDGIPYWSQSQAGSYINQRINTSTIIGIHEIGFRLIVAADASDLSGSDWFVFDNLTTTTVPEPSSSILLILGGIWITSNRRRWCGNR